MKKVWPLNALIVILLGLCVLLLIGAQVSSEPPFSRSRWIEEQKARGAHFSGDPDWKPFPVPAEKIEVEAPARAAGPRNVQVSFDLLAPDSGPAQPETQTEPHLAINPERESHLLAGYQEGRFSDGGARALTYAVSFDSGRSWQEGLLPGLTQAAGGPFQRASDPWVAFGPGNRAYYVSLGFDETSPDNGIFVSTSDDGGRTWGDPVTVVFTRTQDFHDKEAIAVDTRSDSPFRGRVYVAWDIVTTGPNQPAVLSYSADGGQSFSPPVTIEDEGANLGVFPLVGPRGVVHALWLQFTFGGIGLHIASSEDGGATWSEPVHISNVQAPGISGSRTAGAIPAAAVDPRTGDLYVVWQDERFSPGIDQVVLSRSADGGRTWTAPQLVSDGPRNAASFTPAVAVSPEGVVGVVYYSLRNDPARSVLVDEYFAVSRNRGRRFARSLRVSPASWDLRFAAVSRGFFLGDYQGLAAGRRMFHPLWIGTFNASRIDPGSKQPDAFTRPMPVR
ncbi:MAG TPA: sialidase family protein [Thermoanaerobaculia bacterium]|jgi:hypothetical protein